MASKSVAAIDLTERSLAPSEQIQRKAGDIPLVDRINLLLGSLQHDRDEGRYLELLFVLKYTLAQNYMEENKVDLACRRVFEYTESKYPDLYGFVQNPGNYASRKQLPRKDELARHI